METRWGRAVRDARSWITAGRDAVGTIVIGVLTTVALVVAGSPTVGDFLIGLGVAIVGSFVLIPVSALVVSFFTANGRILRDEIGRLNSNVLTLQEQLGEHVGMAESDLTEEDWAYINQLVDEDAGQPGTDLRAALLQIRNELHMALGLLEQAQQTGRFWTIKDGTPQEGAWKRHQELLSREAPANIYQAVGEAYQHIRRLSSLRSLCYLSRRKTVVDSDRLSDAIGPLKAAEEAIDGYAEPEPSSP